MTLLDFTDNFTHDYFADDTYATINGQEGVSFSVVGGELTCTTEGLEFIDPRGVLPPQFESASIGLDVDYPADLTGLRVGFMNYSALNTAPDGFCAGLDSAGYLLGQAQDNKDALGTYSLFAASSRSLAIPHTWSIQVMMRQSGLLTCSVGGVTLRAQVAPQLMALWAARPLHPYVTVGIQENRGRAPVGGIQDVAIRNFAWQIIESPGKINVGLATSAHYRIGA